ncbi:hypothetical protein T11_7051 [Trichinella zimbabwensis]|uniref:Uncharacterized protein n=1 Tax=Trichinella zimbabwensis TaxID=268475 RepID=A0A0V1GWD8_9BILA|nr:hypothetical protein T11_7051 [Trichinella zimbabwensis]
MHMMHWPVPKIRQPIILNAIKDSELNMQIKLPVMRKGKFDCLTYSSAAFEVLSQASCNTLQQSATIIERWNKIEQYTLYSCNLITQQASTFVQILKLHCLFHFKISEVWNKKKFMQLGDQQLPPLYQRVVVVVVHWIL